MPQVKLIWNTDSRIRKDWFPIALALTTGFSHVYKSTNLTEVIRAFIPPLPPTDYLITNEGWTDTTIFLMRVLIDMWVGEMDCIFMKLIEIEYLKDWSRLSALAEINQWLQKLLGRHTHQEIILLASFPKETRLAMFSLLSHTHLPNRFHLLDYYKIMLQHFSNCTYFRRNLEPCQVNLTEKSYWPLFSKNSQLLNSLL